MPSVANHFFDHTPGTLKAWCDSHRMPAFRAGQILEWVYQKGVIDPHAMSNLAKRERDILNAEMRFLSGDTIAHQVASDGVQKLLIQWDAGESRIASRESRAESESQQATPASSRDPSLPTPLPLSPESRVASRESRAESESQQATPASSRDPSLATPLSLPLASRDSPLATPPPSRRTECVMIPTEDRRTACVSSQVGCPVGCRFCASGIGGLEGNLSAGGIVEQVWRLGRLEGVGRISNVVFMGMGEPLANFANVAHAVRTLASLWATGISARKITISTVGLPQAIKRLAAELDLPVTLALSLHAPTDDLRRQLIPWAEYTSIEELLDACHAWFVKTGREITLEYTLLRDVNDRPEHAAQLARLAKTLRANINLIRYNEVEGIPFARPRDPDVLRFQSQLRDKGVNAHIRASRGRDIAAACGQLRHELTPA